MWCTSGVPQGSVLGPLLFLILMFDIDDDIFHAILSSFADDTKIWKGISSKKDEVLLQDDLDTIYRWAEKNNMQFNTDKFQAIRFAALFSACYYNDNKQNEIKQHSVLKDLGIQMSEDLSFNHHIRLITKKGKQMAGWILRTFRARSPVVMLTLLKQLIYPTVEYNSVLWSPTDPTLIDLLESVQNNFLKKINGNLPSGSDYWDRLRHFQLYSLQRRRERYAIIYVWKVIHNLYPNPGLHLNRTTDDHSKHPNEGISIGLTRNGLSAEHTSDLPGWLADKCILGKLCELYSLLPPALRRPVEEEDEPSVDKFKVQLDEWLTTIPDRPNVPSRDKIAASNSLVHQIEYRDKSVASAGTRKKQSAGSARAANRWKTAPAQSRWDANYTGM